MSAAESIKNDTRLPLVSVIMPAYNAEKTLAASAMSVLEQSLKELELIIIDDGSSDGTPEVCRRLAELDGRVRFVSTANAGPAAARNTGLDMARGELIAFADSDDLLEPDMLRKLAEPMAEGADVSVCGASIEYPHGAGNRRVTFGVSGLFAGEELKKLFDLEGMTIFFSGWGKLFRRRVTEGQGLRLNTAFRITEDTDFVMRYLENCGSVYLVDECLYRYMQINTASLTNVRDPEALRGAAENIASRFESLMLKWGMTEEEAKRRADEHRFSQLNAAVFAKLRGSAPHREKLVFYRECMDTLGFKEYLSGGSFSRRVLALGYVPAAVYVRLHRAYLLLRGKRI